MDPTMESVARQAASGVPQRIGPGVTALVSMEDGTDAMAVDLVLPDGNVICLLDLSRSFPMDFNGESVRVNYSPEYLTGGVLAGTADVLSKADFLTLQRANDISRGY